MGECGAQQALVVVVGHVHDCPVGDPLHGELRDGFERLALVQAHAQSRARLREKRQSLLRANAIGQIMKDADRQWPSVRGVHLARARE